MENLLIDAVEYSNQHGTLKGYYAQFTDTVKSLEVGETYVHMPNTWQQTLVKILYIGHGVALGETVTGSDWPSEKVLYKAEGENIGWKYGDYRPGYRLRPLSSIEKV